MKHNIAITGLKGSGKGTLASYLVKQHNYIELSFAHALKDVLANVFDWPRDLLEGSTPESRRFRETVDEWWSEHLGIPDFTPRMAMQNVGTDLFRDCFNQNIWALTVKRKMLNSHTVISDLRFCNEHRIVKYNVDLVVKVLPAKLPVWYYIAQQALRGDELAATEMRDSFPEVHPSEWQTTVIPADITIVNNGTIQDLVDNFNSSAKSYE